MKEFFETLFSPKKALTSKSWRWQYYGAITDAKWYLAILNILVISLCVVVGFLLLARVFCEYRQFYFLRITTFALSVTLLWRVSVVVQKLNTIFCLRKQETRITWSQIILLIVIGLFVISLVELLNPQKDSPEATMLGGAGLVLGWIFKDTIKSVAAFFYLRANGLLKIGDWIEVEPQGIDGIVKSVSLTTVTLENWDTTTSAFPTFILHSQHFKNNQKMMDGKTQGRQMQKTFIFDTGWIQYLKGEELDTLKKRIAKYNPSMTAFYDYYIEKLREEKIEADKILNIQIFRHYIYHWLMQHEHISHEPRLIVRWLEQKNEGLPLQIYAFITDSYLAPFEWQQSQIIEHIVESMAWFNLQLYQSASGYDASNSNITMVNEQADYKKNQTL